MLPHIRELPEWIEVLARVGVRFKKTPEDEWMTYHA
jgi:hypothetical protein